MLPLMAVSCSQGQAPGTNTEPVTTSTRPEARREKAIAEYTEAIRVDPRKFNDRGELPHYLRGRLYAEQGKHDQAVADFTEVIELYRDLKGPYADARLAEAYNARGESYLQTRDYDKAIADYTAIAESMNKISQDINEVLASGGFSAYALYKRGVCYDEKGERDKALADFKEAIRRAPDLARNEDLKRRMGVTE
jgi:tetratricopeptide (TPR) repeat protein